MMRSAILIVLLACAIMMIDVKALNKNNHKTEKILYWFLFSIAITGSLLLAFKVSIPSPVTILDSIFYPINQLIKND